MNRFVRSNYELFSLQVLNIVADEGLLIDIKCSDCSDIASLAAKPTTLQMTVDNTDIDTGGTWMQSGFSMKEFIHLDEYLLV